MDTLPNHLIGKICSLTDDDTIFNIGCSSKSNNQIIQKSKDDIKYHCDNQSTYELNVLKEKITELCPIPYNIHDFEKLNVVSPYIRENIGYIEQKVHISSPDEDKRYTTYYFNTDVFTNDLLTSVKVKGNIYNLSFELATTRSFLHNMTDGFISILPVDEQGYTEILNHFLPYIYLQLFRFSEIILRIQHVEDIDIIMTYAHFSQHHNELIANLTYRRNNVVFTYAIIPEMLYSNLCFDTNKDNVIFEIYPSFISKGIVFIIKQNDKVINNPHQVVNTIEIDIYAKINQEIPSHTYKLNSRKLLGSNIKKSEFYNLNFKIDNKCLYIPLENINFRYARKTIVKMSFNQNHHITGSMDVMYFSKNMIMNKDGFGSRYYW